MARIPFDGDFPLTQDFGENPASYARFGLPGHNGLDYGVPDGTPILAPADGECIEVDFDPTGFGWYVKLRTPLGEDWLLAHMHFWALPRPGQWCPESSLIGYSDNTGNSTGPHVHVGYRPDGTNRALPWRGWARPPI